MTLSVRADKPTAQSGSSATIVLNKPAGTAVGDILYVALITGASGGVPATLAGWTTIDSDGGFSATNQGNQTLYRVVDGSEGSSFTFTLAASDSVSGAILCVHDSSGALTATQVGQHSVGETTASATLTGPSITPTFDNSLILTAFGCDQSAGTAPDVSTPASASSGNSLTIESDIIDTVQFVYVAVTSEVQTTKTATAHTVTYVAGGTATRGARELVVVIWPSGIAPNWPQFVEASAQTNKATATTAAVVIPASGQIAGRRINVAFPLKTTSGTVTPPAGEGWVEVKTVGTTNLVLSIWSKIWGLAGQTDNATTGNFTATNSPTSNGWGYTVDVDVNPSHATAPWTSVAASQEDVQGASHTANTTMTGTGVTVGGSHRTIKSYFASSDDNTHGSPSHGVLAYGGAAYNQTASTTDYSQSMSVIEDTSSDPGVTHTQGGNGPDTYCEIRIVLVIPSSSTPISDTETGAATDAGEAVAVALSEVDTGSAVDAGEALADSLTNGESGAAADAGESIAAALSEVDAAAGTDAGENVNLPVADTDTASTLDTETPAAVLADDDPATADAGESLAVAAAAADTATSSDLEGSIALADGDPASSIDAEALVVATSDTDTASTLDTETPAAALADDDPATATDAGEAVVVLIFASDTAGADDTEVLAAAATDDDVSSSDDTVDSIALAADDAGTGVDAGENIDATGSTVQVSDTDIAASIEVAALAVALTEVEIAAAVEVAAAAVELSENDPGLAVDDESVSEFMVDDDPAAVTELEALTAVLTSADTAAADETSWAILVALVDVDAATTAELESLVELILAAGRALLPFGSTLAVVHNGSRLAVIAHGSTVSATTTGSELAVEGHDSTLEAIP